MLGLIKQEIVISILAYIVRYLFDKEIQLSKLKINNLVFSFVMIINFASIKTIRADVRKICLVSQSVFPTSHTGYKSRSA